MHFKSVLHKVLLLRRLSSKELHISMPEIYRLNTLKTLNNINTIYN